MFFFLPEIGKKVMLEDWLVALNIKHNMSLREDMEKLK